jgi:long-chain acyl-CoA synthetase
MDRFELEPVLDMCEKHGPTWLFAVPAMVQALANVPGELNQLNTVKYLMSAAASLPPAPANKLQDRTGIRVIQAYGMTETCPITHLSPLDPELIRMDSAGLPMNNTEQKIVDIETGEHELHVGEDGEIIIRGPQVMLGYWGILKKQPIPYVMGGFTLEILVTWILRGTFILWIVRKI